MLLTLIKTYTFSQFETCLFIRFNQNYGVLGILDYLHGTDSGFRKSKAFDRHLLLLSLVPLKKLYPDEENGKFKKK